MTTTDTRLDWISVHIFYSSNANPLLLSLVRPLVATLRDAKLIQRYFFIRYWLGGPHIRLRLLPAPTAEPAAIREVIEPHIAAHLHDTPALFQFDAKLVKPLYKQFYIAEYGKEQLAERYGPDGDIPLYPNNSYHYIPYEPELQRYGGPDGLEVSERHFEESSEVVLELVDRTNVHVRSVLFGNAVQLMVPLAYCMFRHDEKLICEFFQRYMKFWQDAFGENSGALFSQFDRKYGRVERDLRARMEDTRMRMSEPTRHAETALERRWIAHARKLRAAIETLVDAGKVLIHDRTAGTSAPASSVDEACQLLLTSYTHMTNNRLGVSILDEVYLSFLLVRALGGAPLTGGAQNASPEST